MFNSVTLRSSLCAAVCAAVLVASAIVMLKEVHLLENIKIYTLNITSGLLSKTIRPVKKKHQPSYFLNIDQDSFEMEFNQSYPLDRGVLAEYLGKFGCIDSSNMDCNKPAVVAIDLDLSPSTSIKKEKNIREAIASNDLNTLDNENYICFKESKDLEKCFYASKKEKKLYDLLFKLASQGIEIALILPEPVNNAELRRAKVKWVQYLISHPHIRFGLASIFSHNGTVLKYLKTPTSFSHAICRATRLSRYKDKIDETIRCPDFENKDDDSDII